MHVHMHMQTLPAPVAVEILSTASYLVLFWVKSNPPPLVPQAECYVCMYACMHICMYVRVYVCIYVSVCACMCKM